MYKVETVNVKGGLVNDAYARVPKLLEEKLNEGAAKGWQLHSWSEQLGVTGKGINIVIVWIVK